MKYKLLVPALLAVGVVVSACSASSSAPSTSNAKAASGPVTVRLGGDWPTLDPYATLGNINSDVILTGIYDRLVALSPDGKSVVPYLATKWTDTPTSLTFTIRPGVTCSDGTKLGAAQVAQSFKYMITQPEVKLLLGAGPYKVSSDPAAGTVTVGLGTPFSDALFDLTGPHASIICPAELALLKAKDTTTAVGSGPYTIAHAVHGTDMQLNPRSQWTWGPNGESAKAPGFPSKVTLQVIPDETTAANELLTGQLDVAGVTGPDVPRLIADKSLIHTVFGGEYLSNLVFNPKNAALRDEKVREAISRAISTKAFMQADTGGFGVTSPSFFAPSAACYDTAVAQLVPAPSVSAAQSILKSDGYTLTNKKMTKNGQPLTFDMVTTNSNFSDAAAEYIAATLGQVGITVKVTSVETNAYTTILVGGNYDLGLQLLTGGGPAPGDYILYMTGPSFAQGGGNTSINDPAANSLVTKAFAATGPSQCQAWDAVQQEIIGQHDVLPLDQQTKQYFSNGVKMTTLTSISLDSLHR
jgi:peptide/nickel transport system substrate-binding protein